MKLKLLLIAIILFNINLIFAQFPGKKTKKNFMAIDSVSYKIGDTIHFGQPTKGENYASIIMYKHKDFFDNLSDVSDALNGQNVDKTKFKVATKKIKEKTDAVIKYFKIFSLKSGEKVHYAIIPYDNLSYLAVPIDIALSIGEIKSKNINYLPVNKNEITTIDDTLIKSFSNKFNVKLLSAIGDKNNQTIKIEFLISHKLVHQNVCFNFGKNDAKMYDFEGNEYLAKSASVGAINKTYSYVCNKIPTNIPVKATIVYKQILSDKDKMSFCTIRVGYKAYDGGKYEYGTLELNNIKIDWK